MLMGSGKYHRDGGGGAKEETKSPQRSSKILQTPDDDIHDVSYNKFNRIFDDWKKNFEF